MVSGARAVRDRPPSSRSGEPRSRSGERSRAGEREPGEQGAPTQPTLRRLRQFDVRPDRELGQNFLIDSNILGVIGRLAELSDADVVLEIGGGVGVLSEYLAARAAHVHVVEIDERLSDALNDALAPFANVTLHWGDALTVDLAGMRPAPTKVIANLPYGVAATALLRTIEELPTVTRWVAMVQREVGERLAADPGGRDYGVPSVLAQLACRVRVARAISRAVFHPVPNVDSVLVELTRTGPAATPALHALVAGAFAHRRKALARSLTLAGVAEREQVRAALACIGLRVDVRAERLAPQEFVALALELGL
jgi:16S rRNA (adenine1518-N6/adenine1519-N6)-dimethyltransferase